MGQDSEWIFASVINFLQSPLWSTPVFNFVDQNCIFFDKEEENKFEYTSIHEAYQNLVEGLIKQHVLKELNITEEQFVSACQEESGNAYAKVLFDQVLAGDDFLTFKKVMFRRNLALETEALAAIHAREAEREKERRQYIQKDLKDVGTPDQQIEAAIRLSKESYETESKKKNEIQSGADAEFKKAVEKSMKEQAELDAIMKKEKEDLEAAISLSIAAAKDQKYTTMKEEERQRIFEMQQSLVRKKQVNDDKQHEVLLELQRQRLLEEDRSNAANSALDRLFARRKMIQHEEFITTDDNEKQNMQQQILEERTKLLEQSNKDRDTALKQYLEAN